MLSNAHHFLNRVPPPLQSILATALNQFRLGEMSIHGPAHWLKVLHNATILAEATPGADLMVVQLFAVLHDCERQNESFDSGHGPRAAALARELHTLGNLPLSSWQLELLCNAAAGHAEGLISSDPTIGVCWDADRLDLPRVGIAVQSKYLSTVAARQIIFPSATSNTSPR
jgi:uncharacterized protein